MPEEPYDSRSLYERLKEQRDKKDLEYEESHKLSKYIESNIFTFILHIIGIVFFI